LPELRQRTGAAARKGGKSQEKGKKGNKWRAVGPCGLNNLKRDRLRMQKKQQQSI